MEGLYFQSCSIVLESGTLLESEFVTEHVQYSLPSWSRFNPNGAVGEDLGAVLKPKLDPKLDA